MEFGQEQVYQCVTRPKKYSITCGTLSEPKLCNCIFNGVYRCFLFKNNQEKSVNKEILNWKIYMGRRIQYESVKHFP